MSVQESFGYFNATVNAAAFKFSDSSTFFVHPLFETDATKRLLRVLPDGLSLQTERDRARSLVGTLHLLTREHLSLVPHESTRRLIRSVATDPSFVHGCEFICRLLDQENRYHEAALIRGWIT